MMTRTERGHNGGTGGLEAYRATTDLFTIARMEARKVAYMNGERVRSETIAWAVAEVDYRITHRKWPEGGLGEREIREG